MLDGAPPAIAIQRSTGSAQAMFRRDAGRLRIARFAQSGSAKVMMPRSHGPVPEIVFLNTSGGLTGGDRLDWSLDLGAGVDLVATTQTAERAYASSGGRAEVRVTLGLGDDARLDWLPQETILFDASALGRRTLADLGAGARFLFCEMVVLGRAAMGEHLRQVALSDWREIRREGRPVLVEPLRLTDASLSGSAAMLGAHRAVATIALVAPGAELMLEQVRAALPADGPVEAAASAWNGKCVVRLLAADALPLKRAVAAVLHLLRGGRPLPRVWQI
ncbi:urease accessory protein UreD [Plastorhodobacter daqingensis]|uniref:Urease accessory protein UreD n=1 Tax=Plastorhodobacter daqingensis TaxID=1387281 RepID=A0ABW2UHB1_9RHOB